MLKRRDLLALLGSGSILPALAAPGAAKGDLIRVAVLPVDSSMEANFAAATGFARDARLDLTITNISSGPAIIAAILGGSLDVGNVNTFSILSAIDRGLPIVAIAGATIYTSASWNAALIVAGNSAIRTGADLSGKTIAVSGLRSLPQFSAMAWIDKNSGDTSSVRFLEMPLPEMESALRVGRVDAASMSEPFASRAAQDGERIFCHVDDGIGSRWLQNAWVSSRAWAEASPDALHRFRAMIYRSAVWANNHQAESARILSSASNVGLDVIATMRRARYAEAGDPNLLEPVIAVSQRYGGIRHRLSASAVFAP